MYPTLIIQHDSTNPDQTQAIADTLSSITAANAPVLAVIPGSEPGVELADRFPTDEIVLCT